VPKTTSIGCFDRTSTCDRVCSVCSRILRVRAVAEIPLIHDFTKFCTVMTVMTRPAGGYSALPEYPGS